MPGHSVEQACMLKVRAVAPQYLPSVADTSA